MENLDNFKIPSIEREIKNISISGADLKKMKDVFGKENLNENWSEKKIEIKVTDEMNIGVISHKLENIISEKIDSSIEGLFWREEKIGDEYYVVFDFNLDVYPVDEEEIAA